MTEMSQEIAVSPVFTTLPEAPRADSDTQLLEIWLHGRSRHTQRAYRADVEHFLAWVRKPLLEVTLADLQQYADSLGELAPASRYRTLSSIKVAARLRPPHRLSALRCRPRSASAGGARPPGRAHPAGGRSPPHPEPGNESPEPGHPHPPLCQCGASRPASRRLPVNLPRLDSEVMVYASSA